MRNKRKKYLIIYSGVLVAFLFSLCFSTAESKFIPAETVKNIGAAFKIAFADIFNSGEGVEQLRNSLPYYGQTIARIKLSVISMFSGMAICFAGTIFQTTFKNPLASPNLLGVSTGVTLGNIIFVLVFQLNAYAMISYRYPICYGMAALIVFIIVLSGKIAGRKYNNFSVETMIILGMIISHLGSVFTTYYSYQITMDENGLADIYSVITGGNVIYVDTVSFLSFVLVFMVTTSPMLLIRYRYNIVTFSDEEALAMGVNGNKLRTVGLILGSFMSAAATIHGGEIGFLSMVIPFLCRKKLHAEFGEVAITSMGIGATLTLLSRSVYNFFFHAGLPVTVGAITTLIVLPIFVVSLIKRDEGFS